MNSNEISWKFFVACFKISFVLKVVEKSEKATKMSKNLKFMGTTKNENKITFHFKQKQIVNQKEHNTVMCTPIPTIGVDENRIIFIRFTEQELQKETSFRSKLKSLNILSFGVDSKLEVGCRWLIIKYIGKDRKILNALNSISKSQGNPNPKWTEQWRIEPGHYYISTFDKILFREWIEEHKNEITSNFSSENVFTIHAEKSIVLPDIVSQYLPVHSETQPTVRPYLINEDCG